MRMRVPVMQIREMRMPVDEAPMPVQMGMRLA